MPALVLSYSPPITADTFDELCSLLARAGTPIETEEREPVGFQASMEWFIPTAVLLYIGKSYFDEILKEMGKDHYGLIKQGLKTLYVRLIGDKAPTVTVLSTAGKITASRQYSLLFSILAEAGDGLKFKLLIKESATESEYEAAVNAFIEFLDTFHKQQLSPELISELRKMRIVGRAIFLTYSAELCRVVPLDPFPARGLEQP